MLADRLRIHTFRGNWFFPWVVQRYLRTSFSGLTVRKACNALRACMEMKTARTSAGSLPFVLRVEPTNVCNLRCPRCSCGIGTDPRPKGYMKLSDFESILDACRNHAILLRLDGNGEPTLHPHIFDMIRIAKSNRLSVSMSTNFSTPACDQAEEFVRSGLDRLVIAIDGNTQESYEKYRVGGKLDVVEQRVRRVVETRARIGKSAPLIEVQFLDWDYNHDEIESVRKKADALGADKFQVIAPDWAVTHAKTNPSKPHRCLWLWCILTVDWDIRYRSCTNAWTLPWPRVSLRDVPPAEFWNHSSMKEARLYNIDKTSGVVAADSGCHCNNCSDMLVVNRPPNYVCE